LNLIKYSAVNKKKRNSESTLAMSKNAPLIRNVAENREAERMPKKLLFVSRLTKRKIIKKQPNDEMKDTSLRGTKPAPMILDTKAEI
jgi:hypothetical protein